MGDDGGGPEAKLTGSEVMKTCYFDAFSGISGDMTVGALVDAGAQWNVVEAALSSLGMPAAFRVDRVKRKGIAATKFTVECKRQTSHRHLAQIEEIISRADISKCAKANAIAVFRRLGEAEAKSHDIAIERVHFHEVGAVDSISDIVAACVALDTLEITEIVCSRINVGSGTVQTEHGVLPVPAPATAELLKQIPIYSAGPEMELTTPTGAALVSTLGREFGAVPGMKVDAQGFGAGDHDLATQANVLRVLVGDRTLASEQAHVAVIEANIDDSTPQMIGYAMERLLEAGALDVALTPIFMKKNRPGTLISVIAAPEMKEQLASILFRETTTLGVRVLDAERRVLARSTEEVETSFGKVHIKRAGPDSFAPEYDDCRRLAREHGVPLRAVIAEANEIVRAKLRS